LFTKFIQIVDNKQNTANPANSLNPVKGFMIRNLRHIGVFDSGYGGLTVLSKLRERLPNSSFIYLGDSAYAPYGEKSSIELAERLADCFKWLVKQGCEFIVIGCNTAEVALNKSQKLKRG